MLKGSRLWFRYGNRQPWVVEDRTVAVAPGEVLGLMAPSGYGKTTLGKLLAGYLAPTRGSVTVDERSLPKKSAITLCSWFFKTPNYRFNPRWRIRQILAEGCPSPTQRV